MDVNSFDNLPSLTKREALDILSKPINKLNMSSDYYKAVSHLIKYPGIDTEDALIKLLKNNSKHNSIQIAKRKAIYVLGLLGCNRAVPLIGDCLKSKDPYIVENAAFSLQQIGCKDQKIYDLIDSLLDDPNQNRRILIQSLSRMGVKSKSSKIKSFLNKPIDSNGTYGAAIAAMAKLNGDRNLLYKLEELLVSSSQNDRQFAVQDIIDAGAIELIPAVLKTPISPFFKVRAVNTLWPKGEETVNELNLFEILNTIIQDNPLEINITPLNYINMSLESLIQELFNTDFSRCYFALREIIKFDSFEIWEVLNIYLSRIRKDYGAIYFLILLFNIYPKWDNSLIGEILEIIYSALNSSWPQYMKFRPLAITTLIKLKKLKCEEDILNWLDESKTPYWLCRYAALNSIESLLIKNVNNSPIIRIARALKNDSHTFVSMKANILFNN